MRVIKGTLQADEGKGKVFFDPQKGRLIRGDRQVRIHGTLTVETAGRRHELKFVSDNRLQWQLLD